MEHLSKYGMYPEAIKEQANLSTFLKGFMEKNHSKCSQKTNQKLQKKVPQESYHYMLIFIHIRT